MEPSSTISTIHRDQTSRAPHGVLLGRTYSKSNPARTWIAVCTRWRSHPYNGACHAVSYGTSEATALAAHRAHVLDHHATVQGQAVLFDGVA